MRVSNSKERLRELLHVLNISQTELCKRTGITKSALSNYLNGDRVPRQDQISKIADACNISASWLLGYDVPMDGAFEKRMKAYADGLSELELISNDVVDNLSVRSVRMAQRFDNVDEDMKRTIEKILSSPNPSRVKIISEEHMDDGSTKVVLRLEED